jgi:outer membrane lipoprotein-sorting protein
MKKMIIMAALALVSLVATAQGTTDARKILDKTAAVVGRKGGASAQFTVSSAKIGSVKGSISIKGNMFHASTPKAIVWYNGKTQWSYMQSTNEVNVSTPTEAQKMKMNPYTFLTMYKTGYTLSVTKLGANYSVRMVAQDKSRSVQEVYLTINSSTYIPSAVKMREAQGWTTINISNFKSANLANSTFTFNAKDFPSAEVIDLR